MPKKYELNTFLLGVVTILLLLILIKTSPDYVIAQGDGLGLASARSYKYDKLLEQYGRSNFVPKTEKIKKEIRKVKK